MIAKYLIAKGMECGNLSIDVAVRHKDIDPLLHLLSGFVGEGKGQNFGRPGELFFDDVGDSSCNNRSFTGSGACYYQKRTLCGGYSLFLFLIEVLEDIRHEKNFNI